VKEACGNAYPANWEGAGGLTIEAKESSEEENKIDYARWLESIRSVGSGIGIGKR
jgi:hypothetical protein